MKNYLKLMRVKHYVKNMLIVLPIIFGQQLLNVSSLIIVLIGFVSFSLATSVIYIINDINDVENDKLHEIKKKRPIASGAISKDSAIVLAIILFVLAIILNLFTNSGYISLVLILLYIILNILYSIKLKNIVLIDITILVSGFIIRLIYGSVIAGIAISNWLYLTVMAFSFYLGFGKRRNEIKKSGSKTRSVLKAYSQEFLDKNMYMCLTLGIAFYSLWCIDPSTLIVYPNIVLTVPIVILICMKYSLIIESDSHGDPIETFMKDKTLIIGSIAYLTMMLIIIYC